MSKFQGNMLLKINTIREPKDLSYKGNPALNMTMEGEFIMPSEE